MKIYQDFQRTFNNLYETLVILYEKISAEGIVNHKIQTLKNPLQIKETTKDYYKVFFYQQKYFKKILL